MWATGISCWAVLWISGLQGFDANNLTDGNNQVVDIVIDGKESQVEAFKEYAETKKPSSITISDYDGEGTEVPREFIPSVAAFPFPGLILAADLSGRDDFDETRLRLGAEYWLGVKDDNEIGSSLSGIRIRENATWSDILSKVQAGIRGGVNDGAFTAGVGLRFKMLEMNYAYQMAHDEILNDSHVYSLLLSF